MLQLTAFEFIVRTIPEAFVYILAGYALSNEKLNIKRFTLSGVVFSICVYFIRMLPINYGVHTILSIIIQIIILIYISKIDIVLSIKSSIITTISLFIIELLNLLVLNVIFKGQLESIMINPFIKTLYGLPSLLFFAILVLYYYNLRKRKKNKYDKN